MPLRGPSVKRSRATTTQNGVPLEGWDFIQEKLLSHDEDMISDYADDIDTLLVFAGLFSAVLTAFLVASLVLLQPDNLQTSVQLLSLLVLQNGAPEGAQPFLNEAAKSLPTSTAFRAPANATTVNTLWLTSLVLSLAAALVGILAKQWCREYLRWHSVIASARENVLIRQVRFEAWDRWRVGPFISFIPAFLEIALVLFLLGLLVFIPTFAEQSLTTVISVVIVSTLIGVTVLTILPVFFRLCPFQTPTGWAFVRLAGPLRRPFWLIVAYGGFLPLEQMVRTVIPGCMPEWLHVIAESLSRRLFMQEKLSSWRAYGLHSVEDPGLCVPAAPDVKKACEDIHVDSDPAAVDTVQTCVLLRALLWIRCGSSDDRVLAAIRESLPSIHLTLYTREVYHKFSFLSSIYAICPTDVFTVCEMLRSFLYDRSDGSLFFRAGPQSPFQLIDFHGPFLDIRDRGLEERYSDVLEAWVRDPVYLEICHALIRSDLRALVDDWLSVLADAQAGSRRVVAERIILLLCVARLLPSIATFSAAVEAGSVLTQPWAETLREVCRRLEPHKAAYTDGLMPVCVQLCRLLGPVSFDFDYDEDERCINLHGGNEGVSSDTVSQTWGQLPWNRECNMVTTWAILAVNVYDSTDSYSNADRRHLFVVSISHVFDTMRLRITASNAVINAETSETAAPLVRLLSCMVDALRWSLLHSLADCGAYTPLPWVNDIIHCYQAAAAEDATFFARYEDPLWSVPLTGDQVLRPVFLLMLRLLQTCLTRGLLTGESTIEDFGYLLDCLGHPNLPDLPEDLTSETIAAQEHALQNRDEVDIEATPEWSWLPGPTANVVESQNTERGTDRQALARPVRSDMNALDSADELRSDGTVVLGAHNTPPSVGPSLVAFGTLPTPPPSLATVFLQDAHHHSSADVRITRTSQLKSAQGSNRASGGPWSALARLKLDRRRTRNISTVESPSLPTAGLSPEYTDTEDQDLNQIPTEAPSHIRDASDATAVEVATSFPSAIAHNQLDNVTPSRSAERHSFGHVASFLHEPQGTRKGRLSSKIDNQTDGMEYDLEAGTRVRSQAEDAVATR